jgi:hypothetical protein
MLYSIYTTPISHSQHTGRVDMTVFIISTWIFFILFFLTRVDHDGHCHINSI